METRETRAALPSPAFSHARGHLRVSRVSLDGLEKKETDRSLSLFLIFEFFLSVMLQVRSSKLAKHSKYAPADGNRYDGIYKVSAVRQCTSLSRFYLG